MERPDLSAVGMTGDLKIDLQFRRLSKRGRIVSQQDRWAPNVSPGESTGKICAPVLANHASTVIIDADKIEDRVAYPNFDAFVSQCSHSEFTHLRDPIQNPGVVVVIPRHEEDTALRAKPAKRSDVGDEVSHITVRQVARHRDQVGGEIVYPTHDALCETPAKNLPDVDVRDLYDPKSIQFKWPTLEFNLYAPVARRTQSRSKRYDPGYCCAARDDRCSDRRN
jgi:hypothetical protein